MPAPPTEVGILRLRFSDSCPNLIFTRDQIASVKSGIRGADVLQMVMSDSGHLCGTILWESKRVRNWSDKWIDKLIEDRQAAKADIAVIVTDALPEQIQHVGVVRGVLLRPSHWQHASQKLCG